MLLELHCDYTYQALSEITNIDKENAKEILKGSFVGYIATLLVRFAYFLDASKRYYRTKDFCRNFLEYPNSKLKFYFDIFMVILVILSVLFLLYEVKNPEGYPYMDAFIQFSLIIFIVEYLLRMWIYSDSHKILLTHYQFSLDNNLPFSIVNSIS